jgi:DNA-binding response OmpR family regulator
MQQEGYFVLSAADGFEAIELSRQYPGNVDLLITDLQMPRMSGKDLCSRLTEERPKMKTLMMSGTDITDIIGQNAKMPFLSKPFNGETLKARVRGILG